MVVTREDLENALGMTIFDEAENDSNIRSDEIRSIKKRFGHLLDKLEEEATNIDGEE